MPSAVSAPLFKEFNKSVKLFVNDLVTTFPDIEHFKLLQASYHVTKNIHRKLPYKMTNEHLLQKYGKQIIERDESYFLSDKFTNDFWPGLVDVIKQLYVSLDAVNKKAIWDHLENLYNKHLAIKTYYINKNKTNHESSPAISV